MYLKPDDDHLNAVFYFTTRSDSVFNIDHCSPKKMKGKLKNEFFANEYVIIVDTL